MKLKFKVEVALLWSDKTWDTKWVDVEAMHISHAGKKAEEAIRKTHTGAILAHVSTVCVQEVED